MNRLASVAMLMLSLFLFVGCGAQSQEDHVQLVVNLLNNASADVGKIKDRVNEALKKGVNQSKQLDFDEALKAVDELKNRGNEAKILKLKVERAKTSVSDEQKQANGRKLADLPNIITGLTNESRKLSEALAEAEKIDSVNTEKLRRQLNEALGLLESISR